MREEVEALVGHPMLTCAIWGHAKPGVSKANAPRGQAGHAEAPGRPDGGFRGVTVPVPPEWRRWLSVPAWPGAARAADRLRPTR